MGTLMDNLMSGSIDHEEIRKRVEKRLEARADLMTHLGIFVVTNGFAWLIWWATRDFFGFMWPLLLTLSWGSGMIAHVMDVYRKSGRYADRTEDSILKQMNRLYGDDWRETISEQDYQLVRKYTEKYYDKRGEFFMHLPIFVLINLLVWFLWNETRGFIGFPWPVILTGGWMIGIVGHLFDVSKHSTRRLIARERAVQQEIEREERLGSHLQKHKRKRDRLMLTEDGELLEVIDEVDDDEDTAAIGKA